MKTPLADYPPPRTVGQALTWCEARLEESGVYFGHGTDNPWDEAVQMVLAVVGLPLDADDGVLPHPVDDGQLERLRVLLQRRIVDREPLPYILGRAWFAGVEFRCDSRALVPRSPLAELILDDYRPWYAGPSPRRLLDLCCGGGCIGLAAAWHNPELQADLLDLDPDALDLAAENLSQLGLQTRCRLLRSDLFEAVGGLRYDLILSNPPYVDAGDLAAMPAEYRREPEQALAAGPDGLDLVRRILARAEDHLEPHGLLVVEVGNSWPALERAYPDVPFTWLEFENGGHGVFALSASELETYRASFSG